MGTRRAARQHGAVLRFDGDHLEFGLARLDHRADAGQCAAGADAAHHNIDFASRIPPDLFRRGAAVDLGICRVLELLGDEGIGQRIGDFFGFGDGPAHPPRRRRQFKFGAEQLQHLAALDRHAFRHRQDQPIALRGANESERNPGIARGRLDQHGPGFDAAVRFRRRNHRDADAVLDRVERVEELTFRQNVRLRSGLFCHAMYPDQRGCADRFGDAVVNAAAKLRSLARWHGGVHDASLKFQNRWFRSRDH